MVFKSQYYRGLSSFLKFEKEELLLCQNKGFVISACEVLERTLWTHGRLGAGGELNF